MQPIIGIHACEAHAKQNDGYDSMKFTAVFPAGPRVCQWLDAYMGLLTIEGVTGGGFLMTRDVADQFPNLLCIPHDMREGSEPKAETEGLGGEAPQSPVASATRPRTTSQQTGEKP